jgi:hypothetical protein
MARRYAHLTAGHLAPYADRPIDRSAGSTLLLSLVYNGTVILLM